MAVDQRTHEPVATPSGHARSVAAAIATTVVVTALVVGGGAGAGWATHRSHIVPSWQTVKIYPISAQSVDDATCESPTNCIAIGQYGATGGSFGHMFVARSANGGATWSETALTAPFFDLTGSSGSGTAFHSLACASKTCVVIGNSNDQAAVAETLATTDGGSHWTLRRPSAGLGILSFADVACPSSTACFALARTATGSEILRTANAAVSWSLQTSTLGALSSISCSSSTACGAVASPTGAGGFFETTNGGATWTPVTTPSTIALEADLTCPAANTCWVAGGPGVSETTDNGATWHARALPASVGSVQSLSCLSGTACNLVGSSTTGNLLIASTTTSGATWAVPGVPAVSDGAVRAPGSDATPNSIACAAPSTCLVTGTAQPQFADFYNFGFILRSGSAGSTWSPAPLAMGTNGISAAACAASSCEAVTGSPGLFIGSKNLGSTWSVQHESIPTVGGTFSDISCPTKLACVAVGAIPTTLGVILEQGASARSTDGGRVWKFASVHAAFSLSHISCPSATVCVASGVKALAAGPILLRSTNGGASWSSLHLPAGVSELDDIACTSTTRCDVVGLAGSSPLVLGTVNGTGWARRRIAASSLAHQISYLTTITCPTSLVCVAGGTTKAARGAVVVTVDAGAKWTALHAPAGAGAITDVACATTTRCELIATGTSGAGALAFGSMNLGKSWARQALPGGITSLVGVTCVSGTCLAVGSGSPGVGVVLRRVG